MYHTPFSQFKNIPIKKNSTGVSESQVTLISTSRQDHTQRSDITTRLFVSILCLSYSSDVGLVVSIQSDEVVLGDLPDWSSLFWKLGAPRRQSQTSNIKNGRSSPKLLRYHFLVFLIYKTTAKVHSKHQECHDEPRNLGLQHIFGVSQIVLH